VVFLLIYGFWNYELVVACSSCMRKFLIKKALLSIPLANILFPMVWVSYLGKFIAAGAKGHSDPAVAEAHRVTREELVANAQNVVSLRKAPRKEVVILVAILLVCAAIWAVGHILKSMEPEPPSKLKMILQQPVEKK